MENENKNYTCPENPLGNNSTEVSGYYIKKLVYW
jgi:hypothetical protein